MKVLVCCANGAGTSLLMEMKVKQAFSDLNIKADVSHTSLSEGKNSSRNFDVVVCSLAFEKNFDDSKNLGVKVIGIKNILSLDEIKTKLVEAGISN
ncbi:MULTISPECIES: PTS sugar transporter subunit IIB [Helcococcus]|uniref:PTS sugar transporter subunit IIB n=1 Tax=Helcococcus bovis TaxID=3153252 RepID=A0ABW9F405_9FIRM